MYQKLNFFETSEIILYAIELRELINIHRLKPMEALELFNINKLFGDGLAILVLIFLRKIPTLDLDARTLFQQGCDRAGGRRTILLRTHCDIQERSNLKELGLRFALRIRMKAIKLLSTVTNLGSDSLQGKFDGGRLISFSNGLLKWAGETVILPDALFLGWGDDSVIPEKPIADFRFWLDQ